MSYNPQNPNGQTTSVNSSPVVIASDQSAIAHNLTELNGVAIVAAAGGIQKVGVTDSLGDALTSTLNALDVNIKSSSSAIGLAAGSNDIGDINVTPAARGGWSVSSQTNLTTTATVSSASGKFGGYMLLNLNANPVYLQVFDTTSAVTLGTTVPTFVIPLPSNATAANGAGANLEITNGIAITSGIKIAATTTATGATTVTTGLTGFVLYK